MNQALLNLHDVGHAYGLKSVLDGIDLSLEAGQVLADVHARDDESAACAVEAVLAAYTIGDESPPVHGILLDIVA